MPPTKRKSHFLPLQLVICFLTSKVEQETIKEGQDLIRYKKMLRRVPTQLFLRKKQRTFSTHLEVDFAVGLWSILLSALGFVDDTLLRPHKYSLGEMRNS